MAIVEDPKYKSLLESAVACWSLLRTDPETGAMEDFLPTWTPVLLKASKNKNDPNLLSYSDAMTGPHREHFIVACKKEIDATECLNSVKNNNLRSRNLMEERNQKLED